MPPPPLLFTSLQRKNAGLVMCRSLAWTGLLPGSFGSGAVAAFSFTVSIADSRAEPVG